MKDQREISPVFPFWAGDVALLILMMIIYGCISLYMGQDASWDLRNYHWYNVYAFLNDRMGWDIAPSQGQTYLNPLADVLHYEIFSQIPDPTVAGFVEGAIHGISGFFLVKIALIVIHASSTRIRFGLIFLAIMVGITGSAGMTQIGLSSHECLVAIFVLAALFMFMKILVEPNNKSKFFFIFISGLILGLGIGLKLTATTYCLGMIASIMLHDRPTWKSLRQAVVFGLSALVGFMITNGFWMWCLYDQFGNPLFPLYNSVFHSPFWENSSTVDYRFFPRDWVQYLFYPFYWAQPNRLVIEAVFRDLRLATVMFLCLTLIAQTVLKRWLPREAEQESSRSEKAVAFLFVFFWASYVAWLMTFSIYRYAVELEMLSGVLAVYLCLKLFRPVLEHVTMAVGISVLIMLTTIYPFWDRIQYQSQYLKVSAPRLPENSLVLMVGTEPISYVIPFFNASVRFISPWNNIMDPSHDNLLQRKVKNLVAEHTGPMYVICRPKGSEEWKGGTK